MALSGGFTHADDGDYLDEAERRRRSLAKQDEARRRRLTPDWFTEGRGALCLPPQGVRVAVVGAGFAGLMAAWYLARCGVQVTVFEANNHIGGRVITDRTFVAPHYIEAGAELIGENHPLWLLLATRFGLTLDPLSEYPDSRLRFRGRDLTATEQQTMATEVAGVQRLLGVQAQTLSETEPWLDKRAAGWDRTSVASALASVRPALSRNARDWFAFTLGNDNCAPISAQSHLGLLASISAARLGSDMPGMLGYWRSTETHRCRGGNDLLAQNLAHGFTVQTDTAVVRLQIQQGCVPPVAVTVERNPSLGGPQRRIRRFDLVVLTAPPTVWGAIAVEPPFPAAGRTVQQGPSIKFITRYPTRFWEQQRAPELYPSARWDELGSLWEGTDNQGSAATPVTPDPAAGPFALSVFSGGPYVQKQRDYPGKVRSLYPHAPASTPTLFVDWPHIPFVQTGYAVPGVGQATTIFPAQLQPHAGCLYFAGEQTSHGFFGYMEGALQSGARAARDIVQRLAVRCPQTILADVPPGGGSDYRGGGGTFGGAGSTGSY